ncbi:MAG TPA: flagellar assembly protein FliH [Woeseiaceae bacterium]|nr:flagellar assembly protein FliH [Woeseiaceae bacterium]
MSEGTAAAERWRVPAIDGSDGDGYLTAGRLEAMQKDAYDEAWQAGHAEGLAAGDALVKERVQRIDTLLHALGRPFDELDEQVVKQLVDLAMTAVRQLFRREISQEPSHIIGVVREAIGLLPIASRHVQLHLHPSDAKIVRECLAPAEGEPAWTIVEDPLMSAGGCTVTTDNSRIDASAEARLNSLMQSIAGDQRR